MKDEQIERLIKNTADSDSLPANWHWQIMLCLKYLLSRIEVLEKKK